MKVSPVPAANSQLSDSELFVTTQSHYKLRKKNKTNKEIISFPFHLNAVTDKSNTPSSNFHFPAIRNEMVVSFFI